MKKVITILRVAALLITAAIVLTGCSTERSGEPARAQKRDVRTVVFHACEVQTKTAFGQGQDGIYPTLWTGNDAAVKLALNYTEAAEAAVVPADNFLSASFTADIDATGVQGPYTFYAVSPASAARSISPSRQAWSISIPADQTPLDGSVDERAQILAAASQPSDVVPGEVDLHFSHLTAYGRMTFKNLDLGGATVDRIDITSTTPLVGDWYWDSTGEGTLTDNGASSTITLRTSRTSDIWFACAPVDMSGELAVFTVYTDQGAFEKAVEFPQGRQFKSGRIAVFNVDMAGITPAAVASDEFSLVTNAAELQDGDQVLILDAGETHALGTNQKTNNREGVAISVTAHTVAVVPSDVQILTLKAGSSKGTWHFSTGNGYLANADGNKNKLLTVSSINDNSTWNISIASSGEATIEAKSGQRRVLRYNDADANNILFACYASGQKEVVIYRKAEAAAGPVEEDPFTANWEYGCYLNTESRIYSAGRDQYSRQYSQSGDQTFCILDPAANEQLEISGYRKSLVKGDKAVITVNWRKGLERVVTGDSYSVKVVREEGPRVWLSDGKGNGFIIKK